MAEKKFTSRTKIPIKQDSLRKIGEDLISGKGIQDKTSGKHLKKKLAAELCDVKTEIKLNETQLKDMDHKSNQANARIMMQKKKLKDVEADILIVNDHIKELKAKKIEASKKIEDDRKATLKNEAQIKVLQKECKVLRVKNVKLVKDYEVLNSNYESLARSAGPELVQKAQESQEAKRSSRTNRKHDRHPVK